MANAEAKINLPRFKLPELHKYMDKNQDKMLESFKEIRDDQSQLRSKENYFDMLKYYQTEMKDLGATTELITNRNDRTKESNIFSSILFGNLFVDYQHKTICVYFQIDKRTDDSSNSWKKELPFLCWLSALKSYIATKTQIPVNIKFIVEETEELHRSILDDIVQTKKDFFNDVEYVCFIIDKKINKNPCLRYGYRGVCHFSLDINCGKKSVDSGKYGGAFNQPLIDAVHIVSTLIDKNDKIAIPNIMKDVAPPSLLEQEAVEKIESNIDELKQKIGIKFLRHKGIATRVMIHQTLLPSITVHGFETSINYSDRTNRAEIPGRATAKFSIRLVPNQTVRDTRIHVENYIRKMWSQYKSPNEYELKLDVAIDPWRENLNNQHYTAAAEAIKSVYNKNPLYICDGSSLAAVSILKSICPQINPLILPLRESDDVFASDESRLVDNYLKNIKVVMAYMCFIHEL